MESDLILTLPDIKKDRANVLADDLRKELMRTAPALAFDKQRDDESAQDFGATIAVIITSAAATAIAKGIANFIAKRGTRVKLRIGDASFDATGIEGDDAAAIVKAISQRPTK